MHSEIRVLARESRLVLGVRVGVVEQRGLLHPVLLRHLVVVQEAARAPPHHPVPAPRLQRDK